MKKIITICFAITSFFMNAQKKDYSYKQDKAYFIVAPEIFPHAFSGGDTQLAFRIVKRIYLGGEFKIGNDSEQDNSNLDKISYGGFVACKLPLNNHLSVWANGGYYNTTKKGYTGHIYRTPSDTFGSEAIDYPSTSELGVKWAIGANFVAGNGIGITIFTPEAKALMIGMVIGH